MVVVVVVVVAVVDELGIVLGRWFCGSGELVDVGKE